MKLLRFCAIAAVISTLVLTACSATSTSTNLTTSTTLSNTYTDDIGRTVTIQGIPQRIVSLAPSDTEILFALGLGSEVVGTDDDSDYPAAATTLPHVGSGYPSFSVETIVSLKPDLVIGFGYTAPSYVSQLESLGIPVVVLAPKDVSGVISDITLVGKITGATAAAETLTSSMQNSLNTIEAKLNGVTDPRPMGI